MHLTDVAVARGSSVLAKSVTPSRIEENMKVVKLSSQDVASLNEISKNGVTRFVYRKWLPIQSCVDVFAEGCLAAEFGVNFGFPDKQ